MDENKPYVISAELEYVNSTLVRRPEIDNFRQTLDSDLLEMGKQTVWLDASLLRRGLESLMAATRLAVVSLDTRYIREADAFLGTSRAVNSDLSEAGYDARIGSIPLPAQLDAIGRQHRGEEVVLVDDVVFSGEMLAWVQRQLAQRNMRVSAVLCGVAIGEGAEKLTARGIEVESVAHFPGGVDDEICERDFTVIPGTGRKIIGQELSALYFDPTCGKPEQWASLPASSVDYFCVASLVRNLRLMQPAMLFPHILTYPQGRSESVIRQVIYERTK